MRSLVLLLSSGLGLLSAQDIDSWLNPLERRVAMKSPVPTSIQADLNLFSARLAGLPPTYWNARPAVGPNSQSSFVARSLAYLTGVSRFAGQNPALGVPLSGAYRTLGGLQESGGIGDPNGALLSYQNSGLFLTQLANQNPNDPAVRGQLVVLGSRIQALGGNIPVWFSVPIGGAAQAGPPRGIPDQYLAPVQRDAGPVIESPAVDLRSITAAERPEYDAAMEKYINASASVQAASSALGSIRQSVNSQGWSLAASSEKSLIRMRLTLEEAKRLIEQKNFEPSRRMLEIAEGEARKVLRSLGQ